MKNIIYILLSGLFAFGFNSCIINLDKEVLTKRAVIHYDEDQLISALLFNTSHIYLSGRSISPLGKTLQFNFDEKPKKSFLGKIFNLDDDFSIKIDSSTLFEFKIISNPEISGFEDNDLMLNIDSLEIVFSSPISIIHNNKTIAKILEIKPGTDNKLGVRTKIMETRVTRILRLFLLAKLKMIEIDDPKFKDIEYQIPAVKVDSLNISFLNRKPIKFNNNIVNVYGGSISLNNFSLINDSIEVENITGSIDICNSILANNKFNVIIDTGKVDFKDVHLEMDSSGYKISNSYSASLITINNGAVSLINEKHILSSLVNNFQIGLSEFNINYIKNNKTNVEADMEFKFSLSDLKYNVNNELIINMKNVNIQQVKINVISNSNITNIYFDGKLDFLNCDLYLKKAGKYEVEVKDFSLVTYLTTQVRYDSVHISLLNLNVPVGSIIAKMISPGEEDYLKLKDGAKIEMTTKNIVYLINDNKIDEIYYLKLKFESKSIEISSAGNVIELEEVALNSTLTYDQDELLVFGKIKFNAHLSKVNDQTLDILFNNSDLSISESQFIYSGSTFTIKIPEFVLNIPSRNLEFSYLNSIKMPLDFGRVGEIPIRIKTGFFSWTVGRVGIYARMNYIYLNTISSPSKNVFDVDCGGQIWISGSHFASLTLTVRQIKQRVFVLIPSNTSLKDFEITYSSICEPGSIDIKGLPGVVENRGGKIKTMLARAASLKPKTKKLVKDNPSNNSLFANTFLQNMSLIKQGPKYIISGEAFISI